MDSKHLLEIDCKETPLLRLAATYGKHSSSLLNCSEILISHPWRVFNPTTNKTIEVCFWQESKFMLLINGERKEENMGTWELDEELNLRIKDSLGSVVFAKKIYSYDLDCIQLETRGTERFSEYDYTMTFLYIHRFHTVIRKSESGGLINFKGDFIIRTIEDLIQFLTYRKYIDIIVTNEAQYKRLEKVNTLLKFGIPTIIVIILLIIAFFLMEEACIWGDALGYAVECILGPIIFVIMIWGYQETIEKLFVKKFKEKQRLLISMTKQSKF